MANRSIGLFLMLKAANAVHRGRNRGQVAKSLCIPYHTLSKYVSPCGELTKVAHEGYKDMLSEAIDEVDEEIRATQEDIGWSPDDHERYLACRWKAAKLEYRLELMTNGVSEESNRLETEWRRLLEVYTKWAGNFEPVGGG